MIKGLLEGKAFQTTHGGVQCGRSGIVVALYLV
ncbi:MAG: hypothetical protein BWY75_01396 [bacterium ADurb.Bin425]|nr:MAG: hypothetical protein BWY75_01396 [bacterium ADurb.Bin425]